MKKQALRKAPLIHSVIQLRFTTIPGIKTISEESMSQLHQKMIEQGFAEKILAKVNHLAININASNSHAIQTETASTRYLFRSEGELETIELSSDETITSLTLKSSSYKNFEEFYQKFHNLLSAYLEVFPGLNDALLKGIGLRYINLIVPTKGHELSDFVCASIIPMSLPILDENKHLHGFSQKYVTTGKGSQLKVAFEEIPTADSKALTKVLPDDLGEHDPSCVLIIPIQNIWTNIESSTYGILDIENIKEFQGRPIDLKFIKAETNELYEGCRNIFWQVIMPKAQGIWEVYDVK